MQEITDSNSTVVHHPVHRTSLAEVVQVRQRSIQLCPLPRYSMVAATAALMVELTTKRLHPAQIGGGETKCFVEDRIADGPSSD